MKITIIGAGSFGTAKAVVAARCQHEVMLWAHDPRVADSIREQGFNPVYLPEISLPGGIHPTSSLEEAVGFSDMLMMVVPSHHYRHVLEDMKPLLRGAAKIVSATKGIENDSLERMSQITADVLGDRLGAFATLSGPTFAL